MFRLVLPSSPRLLAVAAVAVMFGVCVDHADAACGEYVYVRGQRLMLTHETGAADRMAPESSAPENIGTEDAHSGERRGTPCRGPSCSKGSLPPAAPAPYEPVSTEHWACEFSGEGLSGVSAGSVLPSIEGDRADGYGLRIIRPPR